MEFEKLLIGNTQIEFEPLKEEKIDDQVEAQFAAVTKVANEYLQANRAVLDMALQKVFVTIASGLLMLWMLSTGNALDVLVGLGFGYMLASTYDTVKYLLSHTKLHGVASAFAEFAAGVEEIDKADARLPAAKRLSMWVHSIAYEEATKHMHGGSENAKD